MQNLVRALKFRNLNADDLAEIPSRSGVPDFDNGSMADANLAFEDFSPELGALNREHGHYDQQQHVLGKFGRIQSGNFSSGLIKFQGSVFFN